MKPDPLNSQGESVLHQCERRLTAALHTFSEQSSVRRWVVAHSGGLDSQLLLHLMVRICPAEPLAVIHINHHLQPQADSWAEFSAAQAHACGISHQVLDVQPDNASEQAAREARYTAFVEVLEPGDCLLLAHHADDQAETLLFRFLRGSGLAGLSGMPRARRLGDGWLLRPLLECSRKELEDAAAYLKLPYVDDPSNAASDYDRNYLRHQVMPLLKARWPRLLSRWQKNAQLLEEADSLLNLYLDSDLEACLNGCDCLQLTRWQALAEQKQPALLRHWLQRETAQVINVKQLRQINQDVIHAQADANPSFVLGDFTLRRFQECLYLVKIVAPVNRAEVKITGAGCLALDDGELCFEPSEGGLCSLEGVVVRRRVGGERCYPASGSHSTSVKRLLQEAGIPPWLRADWPLLFKGDELVAVPGICTCRGWEAEKSGFSALWRPFGLSDKA